jgi:D-glycero-alpha-D-manno-heptose-7-phosphate kinase
LEGKNLLIRSRAPLRLGLAGGGTDVSPYCDEYGGSVLNATVDMYSYCTIEPTDDDKIQFYAADRRETVKCPAVEAIPTVGPLILHKGIYNRIVKDFHHNQPLSLKMTTYSDAPGGSGLGTSSTMVVAILKAFVEWLKLPLGEYDIAHLAYSIEREDLELSGGKQDQYAATFGGFNFIEFFSEKVIVNPLRVKNWIKNELESSLVLYYTGKSRDSAQIIAEQIQNSALKKESTIAAMNQLKIAAYQMKEAILKGDFKLFSQCLQEGWENKKRTSSVVTNHHLERILKFATQHGAEAAKVSGAGGGGFLMLYCSPVRRINLIEALQTQGGRAMTVKFSNEGTEGWTINNRGILNSA